MDISCRCLSQVNQQKQTAEKQFRANKAALSHLQHIVHIDRHASCCVWMVLRINSRTFFTFCLSFFLSSSLQVHLTRRRLYFFSSVHFVLPSLTQHTAALLPALLHHIKPLSESVYHCNICKTRPLRCYLVFNPAPKRSARTKSLQAPPIVRHAKALNPCPRTTRSLWPRPLRSMYCKYRTASTGVYIHYLQMIQELDCFYLFIYCFVSFFLGSWNFWNIMEL